jgi:hypothetical protein
MRRAVLMSLVGLILVPGLAFAGEGREGRRGPKADRPLPPGVRVLEQARRGGPQRDGEHQQMGVRILAALKSLEQRVARLEKFAKGAAARRPAQQARPERKMRPQGREMAGGRGQMARRPGQQRGQSPRPLRSMIARKQQMAHGAQRVRSHPMMQKFAEQMRGHARRFASANRRNMGHDGPQFGDRDGQRGRMHRGGRDQQMRGQRGRRMGAEHPGKQAECKCQRTETPARATKKHARAKGQAKPHASRPQARKQARPAAGRGETIVKRLTAENARLKSDVRKLQVELKKIAAQIKAMNR